MYLDYFGLSQKPFLITPDTAFLFPSSGHQEALAHLRYGLQREGGFLLLTGEVGTGKTTLCRLLIESLPDEFRLAYVLNAQLDSAGMLAGICRELSIAVPVHCSVNDLVASLYDDLLAAHAGQRRTLVIVEEAQNLAPDVLETLRLLTNLETSTTKLLHILLIGQPELLDTLGRANLRQLNQRVVSRAHLGPLTRGELPAYLGHRLAVAGRGEPIFTPGAVASIYRKTGGVPRLVNLLAEHCLVGAFASDRQRVGPAIARRAARELFGPKAVPRFRGWPFAAGLAATVTAGVAALWLFAGSQLPLSWLETGTDGVGPTSGELSPVTASSRSVPENREASGTGGAEIDPPDNVPASLLEDVAPEESGGEIPDQEQPVADNNPGAFEVLLRAWGVAHTPLSVEETCATAGDQGLRCQRTAITSLADIEALNRPILVALRSGEDGLEYAVISALYGDNLSLGNSSGSRLTAVSELLARLQGEGIVIWRPPEGFDGPLVPGTLNPPMVAEIKRALMRDGYIDANVVTGGVYNDFLAAAVRRYQADQGLDVDGIAGFQTLLRMTGGDQPVLVMR